MYIGQYRREGLADSIHIEKTIRICHFNFQAKEIKVSLGVGSKTMVEENVPSIFASERKEVPADRKSSRSNISVAARIGQIVEAVKLK